VITRTWLKSYIRAILVDNDPNGPFEFTDGVMNPAINESVIAIARLRPEEFAETIELAWDETSMGYRLPDTHDRLLFVLGHLRDNKLRALKGMTYAEATDCDSCWLHSDSQIVSTFVWSAHDPRSVRTNGKYQDGDKIVASASKLPSLSANDEELPVPIGYLPELIDHTFKRLYQIESMSQGQQNYHDQLFRQGSALKLQTDNARNPIAASNEASG
jgi:hypothetical protein